MTVKIFDAQIKEKRPDGGKVLITSSEVDRDGDRVFFRGGGRNNGRGLLYDTYMNNNPVVLVSHNYHSPEYIAGKTDKISVNHDNVTAEFTLRPPASPTDLQNVTRLAWEGGWMRSVSIGFLANEKHVFSNEHGGRDIYELELLEYSLVAVPSLRSAGKSGAMVETAVTMLGNVAPLAAAISDMRRVTAGAAVITKSERAGWSNVLDGLADMLPVFAQYPEIAEKTAASLADIAREVGQHTSTHY